VVVVHIVEAIMVSEIRGWLQVMAVAQDVLALVVRLVGGVMVRMMVLVMG